MSIHSEAVVLREQQARWMRLGKDTTARMKADASSVSLDGVAKALVSLGKAVEMSLSHSPKIKPASPQAEVWS